MTPEILMLDDSEDDIVHARHILAGIAQVKGVANKTEFLAALCAGGFDLVIVDWKLCAFSGLEAIALAKAICPEIPVVVFSGSEPDEVLARCLDHGALDYFHKDRPSRMLKVISRLLKSEPQPSVFAHQPSGKHA